MIYISSTTLLWSIFFFFILIIFIIDHYIYNHKKIERKNLKHSYFYYFHWFFLSLFFSVIFWFLTYQNKGSTIANENIALFFTGYLLEILLSIDNVFGWFLIFKSLKIPKIFQRKILLYGVWGALILRSILIFYGEILFSKYNWFLYLFGIFFVFASAKVIFFKNEDSSKEKKNRMFFFYKIFRVSKEINSKKFFFIIKKNKLFITPLFLSLIVIELSDIVFAIDSIPAIFSITNNFFIILTSNIFSVLGLRSMYFFISIIIDKNPEIEYGLSFVLMFIGFKILFSKFFVISTFITLLTISIILIITFLINRILYFKKY